MNDSAQAPRVSPAGAGQHVRRGNGGRWLPWLVGIALISALCIAALRFSEAEEIARIAERAQPWWLTVALLLQGATYLAQGEIWRLIGRAAHYSLSRAQGFRLSLAKLFVDQAVPTAGVSGTAAVARHLERAGMPVPAVRASVVVNLTSYFASYVVLLLLALAWLPLSGPAYATVAVASAVFIAGSIVVIILLLRLPGRAAGRFVERIGRIKPLRSLVEASAGTDISLVRDGKLFVQACAAQVAIMLLDAATLWVLIRALGGEPSAVGVFSSFMISNLFRTLGVLPGGLGTFEASSVVTLGLAGVSLPVALSATLLFRGLSFWLPMIPGVWLSRRLFSSGASAARAKLVDAHWARAPESLLEQLGSTRRGLSSAEAAERLRKFGANRLREEGRLSRIDVLVRQVASPLQLLLVFAAIVAAATGEVTDAVIVLTILCASAFIGYRREYSARAAAAALRERVKVRTTVIRDGAQRSVPAEEVVPGDIVLLSAGSLVPADALVLEATDCYVSEAVLTGESFPVEKAPAVLPADTPLQQRSNCVFLGTNVRSGTVRCVAVSTGSATMFGTIAERLTLRPPTTEFDRGTRRFGYMLTSAMLVIVLVVFVAHMLAARPVVDTLLFAVALAVGLSPELLPAILSVNLARGAEMMAGHGVLASPQRDREPRQHRRAVHRQDRNAH
jgi:P-type Mg2+ transporter